MGTISDKLMRIISTKEDIRQALISKGYDVPTSIPFKEYAKMILDLPCKADSFPDIEGIVARYSASGLTNEQMAANPVWVDKTGNGHDLRMKNFLWGGMSGVGGYVDNWNSSADWDINSYWVNSHTDHKLQFITAGSVVQARSNNIYNAENVYKNILNVNGLTEAVNKGAVGGLRISAVDPITSKAIKSFSFKTDGIIQISFDDVLQDYFVAYLLYGSNTKDIDITIEQLPLYPGFILGDGVDDEAATIDNLDLEDTYTVYTPLILLKYGGVVSGKSSAKDFSLNTVVSSKSIGFDSANAWSGSIPVDLFEFALVVCKRDPKTMYVKDLITGKANQRNSKEFVPNPGKYFIWRNTGGSWCQVAIAGQIICNGHFSTDEDDEKVLDWYKKQYPWLFFDQAWTTVGKTNEDEDRATIANITGNGNDLLLSNFGFAQGSGYNEEGEYAGYLVTDGVDDKAVSKQFKIGENFTVILDFKFPVKKISYCGFDLSSKVRIQNLQGSGVYVVLKGNKTLIPSNVVRAVTSEGKVYDENWNEYNIVPGNVSSNYTMVNLGFDGSNQFAESATKLAGIYSSTLSKDDCIKAYNYLQTLKAK